MGAADVIDTILKLGWARAVEKIIRYSFKNTIGVNLAV
ncbi:hypothetical protein FVER14953_21530 [Fusarium verticillioides]|nr:hypothetical protein FVER14953_21530 [Fusarium verticillioides]